MAHKAKAKMTPAARRKLAAAKRAAAAKRTATKRTATKRTATKAAPYRQPLPSPAAAPEREPLRVSMTRPEELESHDGREARRLVAAVVGAVHAIRANAGGMAPPPRMRDAAWRRRAQAADTYTVASFLGWTYASAQSWLAFLAEATERGGGEWYSGIIQAVPEEFLVEGGRTLFEPYA